MAFRFNEFPFGDLLNNISDDVARNFARSISDLKFEGPGSSAVASASACGTNAGTNAGTNTSSRAEEKSNGHGHRHGSSHRHRQGPWGSHFRPGRGGFHQFWQPYYPQSSEEVWVSPYHLSFGLLGRDSEDQVLTPPVDVYDTPKSFVIVANVAGSDHRQLNIAFETESNELTLSGTYVQPASVSSDEFHQYLKVSERSTGKFERQIRFPASIKVDDSNIKAKYANGVLKITVPKVEPVVPEKKKIVIDLDESDHEADPAESVPDLSEKNEKVEIETTESSETEAEPERKDDDGDTVLVEKN